ncbi:MAG: type III-B CRISPR module RAMP protein Cmr4 [Magnetococcales bacterium]|nr:type III-B CRISPR module RAMP protein Cmr4 [Magnetococcales bacterium]
MSLWKQTLLTGIHTLAPLHVGSGRTMGAVDLPIARDAVTGFPIIPASALKGVARQAWEDADMDPASIEQLFGTTLKAPEDDRGNNKSPEEKQADKPRMLAGGLLFTEGRLLAYPVRSMDQPFRHVTCPLILETLHRDLLSLGLPGFLPENWKTIMPVTDHALCPSNNTPGTMVLEDLHYVGKENVVPSPATDTIAEWLSRLLPVQEPFTRQRLQRNLAVIPDAHFNDLMHRVVPVRARIQLTQGKTTDTWYNEETGKEESGNLWYEEYLPPECLFAVFVGERRQKTFPHSAVTGANKIPPLESLTKNWNLLEIVQMGGNETVGHGLCHWQRVGETP